VPRKLSPKIPILCNPRPRDWKYKNALTCSHFGSQCESWTKANPTQPCAAGSFDVANSMCFLKPGDLNAEKRNNAGVISTIKI
jgi:hypothetical protein